LAAPTPRGQSAGPHLVSHGSVPLFVASTDESHDASTQAESTSPSESQTIFKGECLARISVRTLFVKDWKPCYWVIRKDRLWLFRNQADYEHVSTGLCISQHGDDPTLQCVIFRLLWPAEPSWHGHEEGGTHPREPDHRGYQVQGGSGLQGFLTGSTMQSGERWSCPCRQSYSGFGGLHHFTVDEVVDGSTR
jgi:hypothetical protein